MILDDLECEMRIGLLGPLEITVGGRPVAIVRRRERCLFAVLALAANRIVPVSRLIGLLWETEPPAAAQRSLQSHVSRLRSLLAATDGAEHPVRLLSHDGGYSLQVPQDAVDAHRFRDMVAKAATLAPSQKAAQLDAALSLWRGELLDGCGSADLRSRLAADLEDLRLTAMEDWAAAELALGRHRQLISRLAGLHRLASLAGTPGTAAHAGPASGRPADRGARALRAHPRAPERGLRGRPGAPAAPDPAGRPARRCGPAGRQRPARADGVARPAHHPGPASPADRGAHRPRHPAPNDHAGADGAQRGRRRPGDRRHSRPRRGRQISAGAGGRA